MDAITEALIAKLIEKVTPKLIEVFRSNATDIATELRIKDRNTFQNYILTASAKYSHLKTFFVRDERKYLYDFYVPASVAISNNKLHKVDIQQLASLGNRYVILGNAGAGKSILMRHLFLNCIISSSKIPIFIELRNLDLQALPLKQAVLNVVRGLNLDIDENTFDNSMKQGIFCFLFDGFDEVSPKLRLRLAKELSNFALGSDCMVIVSSRPDLALQAWHDFSHATICSLTLEEASELVDKVPFDQEIKGRFLKRLRSGLYTSHESFASNPLLLSIMLMTFEVYAEIPSKFSIFYSQAYEALFQMHDAQKGAFVRERLTQHDIVDFARLFGAFSLISYDKRKFRFSESDALEIVRNASDIISIQTNPINFIADARQAVCLLVEDGLELSYTHRSFQEYFVARFISDLDERNQKRLMKQLSKTIGQDSVMMFLHEMRPRLVESQIIIPGLKSLFRRIGVKKKVTFIHWRKYFYENFSTIFVGTEPLSFGLSTVSHINDLNFIAFVAQKCGSVSEPIKSLVEYDKSAAALFVNRYKNDKLVRDGKIAISDLPQNSPILLELSGIRSIFSLEALIILKEALRDLERKHAAQERSLHSLIK